jgi:hypothetical protein
LRLSIEEFKGRTLLNCRVWYLSGEGATDEFKPGKGGFGIAIARLPEVIAALQRLEREALASGLLEPPDRRSA